MTDIVAPPTIDALPSGPRPTDTPAEFDSKAFATLSAQEGMVNQVNASNAATHQNAVAANERASAAASSASAASASAATATTKRDEAVAAAGTATTKAGEASASASTAATKRDEAVAARDVAVPAAAAAEAARDLAQGYRDQAEVFATQQLKATSTTSLTPGAGNKTFAIETSRSFVTGMYLVATSAGAPADKMSGYVVSYNGATGQLVIAVDAFAGSTARADWVIGVAAPGSAGGLATQVVTANTACVANVAYIVAAAGITLTLPTSWSAGDKFAVVEAIGNGAQYTLNFGSTPLRSRAVGSQVISAAFGGSGELTHQDATRGLV